MSATMPRCSRDGRGVRRDLASFSLSLVLSPLVSLAFVTLAGCAPGGAGNGGDRAPTDWSKLPATANADRELAHLGTRQETVTRVCARGRGDAFARALCASAKRPEIRDFSELLALLKLERPERRAFVFTGNSTSLVAKSVSAINPRLLVFPRVGADLVRPTETTALGFVRGEPFVEIVSRDDPKDELNFYLVAFEQRCSYEAGGCDKAALLTEEIEHDWTAYSVYDHEDLEPTSFDCLSCHRPEGAGRKRILRMQELDSPWLHWFPQRFVQRTDSDRTLMTSFLETHRGDAQYGGIPLENLDRDVDEGSAAQLEALIRAEGFADQPNPFNGQIAKEAAAGESSTWQARFATHLKGGAGPTKTSSARRYGARAWSMCERSSPRTRARS